MDENKAAVPLAGSDMDVLLAEPVPALFALAFRWLPDFPERAAGAAALAGGLHAERFDLAAANPEREPAAQAADALRKWACEDRTETELRIWSLHLACRLLDDGDVTGKQLLDGARRLRRWLADGKMHVGWTSP